MKDTNLISRSLRASKTQKDAVLPSTRRSFFSTRESRAVLQYALADIGEGIRECEIIQWFVKVGDRIEQFDKICEVQSDKASVEISSRYDGVITKLYYDVGAMARVGNPLVDIDTGGSVEASTVPQPHPTPLQPTPAPTATSAAPPATTTSTDAEPFVMTTPAVRRLAKEQSVDLAKVRGTGKNGRITKEDIMEYTNAAPQRDAIASIRADHVPSPAPAKAPISTASKPQEGEIIPLTAMQRAMFKQMTKSLAIPHFGYSDEIDLTQISLLRSEINSGLARHDSHKQPLVKKVTLMPIFIKAMSMALKDYSILNAQLLVEGSDAATAQLKYNKSHNIGVAMDTPGGLIVPNIKNVESKSILAIAAELDRLKDAGRRSALSPSDLSGGNITISNIGNIGGTLLHPVIVPTEVCIGAIGRVQRLPRIVEIDGEERVVGKDIVHVSWNADHRVIDGATMARFVTLWKAYLESPGRLLAEMS
ncbi:dihydrolipoyllysine-residue (2-methylpropanoyl)transferase [Synchytrium microbalum]|uniref:Dihydrolipoamide acetyltransferase component of pyruvate dehydrogenase complex n=1 Tax=Synchytrium microbalum TaxID=1806994 RepID=A0A507BZE3_9FUNG|nr:dihydrolipoyllysine-residue (2-methylpropanoyl)transferase [Synchytrium microbalum]TPX32229.1 dihydrolipoyllysine-residue (2-methylpropanoyl)transferase [Synchytrium microbalum]